MAAKTIEARLVISGEDRGASSSIASVVKSVRQLEEVSKISAPLQRMAKDFQQVEQASKAVNAAMSARAGFSAAEAGLRSTQGAAQAAAKALEQAKVARAAFDGVKAAKGSDQAKQIEAATKAVRELTAAQKRAEGDVRRATAAIAAQSSALQHAEASATKFGADLGNLEAHQQRLRSTTEAATDAMRRQVRVEEQAARATAHHAKEEAEFLRHRRAHGLIGAGAAVASGAVGVHGVGHVVAESAKSGAEVQSNRVDMAKAGIPFAERQHITDESLKLAVRYKNVTQASVMELWKEMRSVVTHPEEVDHVIEPMVRAKSLLDAKDKTGNASHGLNLLVKGAEAIGAAKDPERFNKLLDGYVRAMQVMGSTITPEGIYEMQKYSKTSGGRWSDRFIMTTAQSLGQELGGSTAGNSIDIATKQIVGGMQNLHSKAKEFARIGLIDPKNLDVLKTGEVKGVKAGVKHAVKGDDLAASDLDLWVYNVLLPAMQKHGIKTENDQLAWIQKNFTGTGANVISKLVQQRESFEAHAQNYKDALGTAGVGLNRSDPTAGMGALSKSLETFLGVVSTPIMAQAAHALDTISAGIGSFSLRIDEFNKAHPTIAKFEAPVAAGAAVAGAGLASATVYTALSSGFGLKTSAVALDHSALMLDAAAVKLGASSGLPDVPGASKPGLVKRILPSLATAGFAGLGAAGIGYLLSEYGDASKSVNGTGGRPDDKLTLNPGDELPGLSGSTDAPSWAPKAQETGKAIGTEIGKGIVEAPLPPRRPTMLEDFKTKADEAGTEAGKTLLQKITEAVGAGIMLPINFVPGGGGSAGGGGGGLIQRASFSPGGGGLGGGGIDLGGAVRRASIGGGSGGLGGGVPSFGGGGGGGRGISARDMRNIDPEFAAHIRASALSQGIDPNIALRIANSEGLRGSNPNRLTPGDYENGKPTSFGPFQLHYGRSGGLGNRYTAETGHHAGDPRYWKEQIDFALRTARKEGWGAWYGRRGAGIGVREGIGTVTPVPMPKEGAVAAKAPDGEPKLIKGLDGKEGLDLGNGTMKMPDGSIRSITRSGLEIPEAPAGGIGGGGRKADMQAAADRMHAAAERFENASFHGQIELTGLRRSGVRATSLKIKSGGGMSADLGISEPGAKEDMSDWT